MVKFVLNVSSVIVFKLLSFLMSDFSEVFLAAKLFLQMHILYMKFLYPLRNWEFEQAYNIGFNVEFKCATSTVNKWVDRE